MGVEYKGIDFVARYLKRCKERGQGCTLIIGAGCSRKAGPSLTDEFVKMIEERYPDVYESAEEKNFACCMENVGDDEKKDLKKTFAEDFGVPLASEFIELIKLEFPEEYEEAREKTYPGCMDKLMPNDRRNLIKDFAENARINWAHICMAQLMNKGYLDRILSINFDLLAVRACSLLGFYPGVYDFAVSKEFDPVAIPKGSIFHLHGQYTGAILANTPFECETVFQHIEPIIKDSLIGRPVIAVGYSGENDSIFECLSKTTLFGYGLFWVGFKEHEPSDHLKTKLLDNKGNYAYFVKDFDADSFFISLADKLGCFPPEIFDTPFSFLQQKLDDVAPGKIPWKGSELDVITNTLKRITAAIERLEKGEKEAQPEKIDIAVEIAKARKHLFMGEYEKVLAFIPEYEKTKNVEFGEILSTAFTSLGNALSDKGKEEKGEEAVKIYEQAIEKYRAALKINPEDDIAINNWGYTLGEMAAWKVGEEAAKLYKQAIEKFKAALEINSKSDYAINNWGRALNGIAGWYVGEKAVKLHKQAIEKFKAALEINSKNDHALNNWGYALKRIGGWRVGMEAVKLYEQAIEKYQVALDINPKKDVTLSNWGGALNEIAKRELEKRAIDLFVQAEEKLEAALSINPKAYTALAHLGRSLIGRGKLARGEEAEKLFEDAKKKLLEAESNRQGSGSVNLARISAFEGNVDECRQWLEQAFESGMLRPFHRIDEDPDFESVHDTDWFKKLVKKVKG